ncbi:MAG TPA: MFS transporter, partial [Byssovorax sp.]
PAIVCAAFGLVATRTLAAPPKQPVAADAPPDADGAAAFRAIALVLARSPGFWMSCVLSFLLTFLRTVFLDWTILFLVESGTAGWKASFQSMLFPLTGVAGTLFAGWYTDRVGKSRRGPVAAVMLGANAVVLLALARFGVASPLAALGLIALAGFLLLGPYSLLGGCLALDYGGKRAAATAAGVNDGVGYLGGSASGLLLAGVVAERGWTTAFLVLAAASAAAFVVALVFAVAIERPAAPAGGAAS